jgi:hypothetical protein
MIPPYHQSFPSSCPGMTREMDSSMDCGGRHIDQAFDETDVQKTLSEGWSLLPSLRAKLENCRTDDATSTPV